jgi:hypothetical protein
VAAARASDAPALHVHPGCRRPGCTNDAAGQSSRRSEAIGQRSCCVSMTGSVNGKAAVPMPPAGTADGARRGLAKVGNGPPWPRDEYPPARSAAGFGRPAATVGAEFGAVGSAPGAPSGRDETGAELTGFEDTVRGPGAVDWVPEGGGAVPRVCTWDIAGPAGRPSSTSTAAAGSRRGEPCVGHVRGRVVRKGVRIAFILLPVRPRDGGRRALRRPISCLRVRAATCAAARRS